MLYPKRILPICLLLTLLLTSLWSAVEVDYVPTGVLRFYRSGDPGPYFQEAAPTNSSANYFVSHLGTLTFRSTDGQLFYPTMINIATNVTFVFRGMMDNGVENSVFRLASAYRNNNKEEWTRLDHGNNVNPLTNISGNLNATTYEVRIYLISDQPASRYVYNATYTWVSGDFGGFNIQAKKTVNSNTYDYVPVNGQVIPPDGTPPASPVPILVTGTTIPTPLPFGDPVYNTSYLFSILNVQSFNPSATYGTSKVPIATANLKLEQADPRTQKTYGVNIKFANSVDPALPFRLKLVDTTGLQYFIPYSLTFGGQTVTPNVAIPWSTLDKVNPNTKEIAVTGINQQTAERAPEGIYRDTIQVSISPL